MGSKENASALLGSILHSHVFLQHECLNVPATELGAGGVEMSTTYPVPAFTEPAGYDIKQIIVEVVNQYRLDHAVPPLPESSLVLCCCGIVPTPEPGVKVLRTGPQSHSWQLS